MTQPQSILVLIKKDHDRVDQLFTSICRTSEKAVKRRKKLFEQLQDELTFHMKAEERALYPILKEHSETKDLGFESVEEHDIIRHLLDKADSYAFNSSEWMGAIFVLKEIVEHHVREEEGEMFRKLRKIFSTGQLKTLGVEFQMAKGGFLERVGEMLVGFPEALPTAGQAA